jgi:hypothetical protein
MVKINNNNKLLLESINHINDISVVLKEKWLEYFKVKDKVINHIQMNMVQAISILTKVMNLTFTQLTINTNTINNMAR